MVVENCCARQIFTHALEQFSILIIQSKTSERTPEFFENGHASMVLEDTSCC